MSFALRWTGACETHALAPACLRPPPQKHRFLLQGGRSDKMTSSWPQSEAQLTPFEAGWTPVGVTGIEHLLFRDMNPAPRDRPGQTRSMWRICDTLMA